MSNTSNATDIDTSKPKCVSQATWERFQAVKKRTEAITKRSTEKRIKHLQKTILKNVEEKFTLEEDQALLRENGIILGGKMPTADLSDSQESAVPNKTPEKRLHNSAEKFQEVEKYLGINDRLREGSAISGSPSSGLEKQIEDAISAGDIITAEKLSDKLSTRNYGVKISEAIAARDFMKRKKEEEESETKKKKKKLNWGFEHKQRWETKSNM